MRAISLWGGGGWKREVIGSTDIGCKSSETMKSRGKDGKCKLAQNFSSASHKAALQELAHFANNMAGQRDVRSNVESSKYARRR